MLFRNFIKAYIEDLNSCWSEEIEDLTEDEINKIANAVEENDYIWEVLDEAVFDELEQVKRNREWSEHDESI